MRPATHFSRSDAVGVTGGVGATNVAAHFVANPVVSTIVGPLAGTRQPARFVP